MKVKIRNEIYDSNKEPIVLILSEEDKINIGNMAQEAQKFCSYPDTMNEEDVKMFMKGSQ